MPGLRRELGVLEMTAVAASMMLGTGIFFGPSITAREFPDLGLVLTLWAAGGAVALCGAWAFGRLGAAFPLSGGPYVYVREAYGGLVAFLFAWTSFVVIAPTSIAVLARVFADHLHQVAALSGPGRILLALWSIAAATFVNLLGVKSGGRVQVILTGLKIGLVAGLIVLLLGGGRGPDAAEVDGGGRFAVAFVGILFAVGGWEYAVLASEEVRDPRRTIPRALLAGTAVVVVLYLLVVFAYLAILGADGVAGATALAPEAAERAVPGSARFVAVAVAVSAIGTINAIVLLGPRATFAAARDGLLPEPVRRVSARWGTPVLAILLQAVLASTYLLTGALDTVATYTVIGTGAFIVLSALAYPRLLPAARGRWTPRRVLELAAPFAVAGAYGWFIIWLLADDPRTALVGLGLIAAGLVPYLLLHATGYRFVRSAPPSSPAE